MSTSPKSALLEEYALVARALAAPARLRLFEQIAQGERGVEALADKTGLTTANASQHLQLLRRAGLVTSRRAGKSVLYRLSDAKTLELMELLGGVASRNLARVSEILSGLSGGEDLPDAVSRDDLARRMAEGSVTILDVRPADEYATGHIPGARNVAPDDLERIAATVDPGAQVVAYCRGPYCIYAYQAVAALRRHGVEARRLEGGLPDWREEGRPVRSAPG